MLRLLPLLPSLPPPILSPKPQFRPVITVTKLRSQMGSPYTTSSQPSKLLFRQLFEKESSTYTYLLADASHPHKPALVCFLIIFTLVFLIFMCYSFVFIDYILLNVELLKVGLIVLVPFYPFEALVYAEVDENEMIMLTSLNFDFG